MLRKDREMPAKWAESIIDKCKWAVVSMTGEDGAPYCTPVSIARDGNFVYFHSGKAAGALRNMWSGLASVTRMRRPWAFVLYTAGIWCMYMLMCYFVFRAVPALSHLTLLDALFISSVGNIASVIPVPGGIGAYHYLVALALQSLYGASWETGILAATLNHELHAIIILLVGALSYACLTVRRKK